jgi:hypothetical protein
LFLIWAILGFNILIYENFFYHPTNFSARPIKLLKYPMSAIKTRNLKEKKHHTLHFCYLSDGRVK